MSSCVALDLFSLPLGLVWICLGVMRLWPDETRPERTGASLSRELPCALATTCLSLGCTAAVFNICNLVFVAVYY
ncbi:hypothetical protein FKP32DRAFT_1588139 [Trametes sanguinea]|nr:hypothetical protein FKP32DRAFT_1588139 [Trametes sanguinea]